MNSIWVTAGDGAWCHSLNIIWWAKGSNPFNMIVSASHKVHNKITTTTSSSQSTHHSADCASVGSFRATGPWDISRLWEVHCHGIGCFSLKPRDSSLGLLTTILHDFSHHTQKKNTITTKTWKHAPENKQKTAYHKGLSFGCDLLLKVLVHLQQPFDVAEIPGIARSGRKDLCIVSESKLVGVMGFIWMVLLFLSGCQSSCAYLAFEEYNQMYFLLASVGVYRCCSWSSF